MRGRNELAGLILALAASMPAFAEPPPWLTAQDVMFASVDVASKVPGVTDLTAEPKPFDPSLKHWTTLFRTDHGAVVVTIDESTGRVCGRYEHTTECAATGSVSETIATAKAAAKAREEAKRSPAPADSGDVTRFPGLACFVSTGALVFLSCTVRGGNYALSCASDHALPEIPTCLVPA